MVCTQARAAGGRAGARRRLRLGQLRLHAALAHGVEAVGITLSEPQAELARQRVAEAGVADRVEIRVMDYRDLAGESFDAIATIGMVEHVGAAQIDVYAEQLASLLEPGGRLLNHGITRLRHSDAEGGPFSERYVFPDGEPLHLSRVILALERAGFITQHVEEFGADYAETLRHWIREPRREPRARPSSSPARSGCASGASTCAPPATASRSASPRSTRCSAGWAEPSTIGR